jgi:hypothetical protein
MPTTLLKYKLSNFLGSVHFQVFSFLRVFRKECLCELTAYKVYSYKTEKTPIG